MTWSVDDMQLKPVTEESLILHESFAGQDELVRRIKEIILSNSFRSHITLKVDYEHILGYCGIGGLMAMYSGIITTKKPLVPDEKGFDDEFVEGDYIKYLELSKSGYIHIGKSGFDRFVKEIGSDVEVGFIRYSASNPAGDRHMYTVRLNYRDLMTVIEAGAISIGRNNLPMVTKQIVSDSS